MDPRTAAHTLDRIGDLLELQGENRFRTTAYRKAARAVLGVPAHDLAPSLRSGELGRLRGIGPATLAVLRDLIEKGESAYLERLRAKTPEGLVALLRVPGLSPATIAQLHATLGIDSLEALDQAASDGRLVIMPGIGPKTAAKIRAGIARVRESGTVMRYPEARAEAEWLLTAVAGRPDVEQAIVAGSVRRHCEVVRGASSTPTRTASTSTGVGARRRSVADVRSRSVPTRTRRAVWRPRTSAWPWPAKDGCRRTMS